MPAIMAVNRVKVFMIIRKLLFVFIALSAFGCGKDDDDVYDLIPNVFVREQINVMDLRYPDLRNDNGFAYIPGGVKGIIVFRQNSATYLAFERNCPFQPYDSCATVHMDPSKFFFADLCCGSQFNLSGQPIGGPARFSLKKYSTSLSGNTLTINN